MVVAGEEEGVDKAVASEEKLVASVGDDSEVKWADDWSSSEDDLSYIPSEEEESEDDISDAELVDEHPEYLEVRKTLRNRVTNGICDEVLGAISGECGFSDYKRFDDDVYSSSTNDERITVRERIKRIVYNPRCDHEQLKFTMGMRFVDGFQARDALVQQAIENGKEIRFKRISKEQVDARCKKGCAWRIYGSEVQKKLFALKTVKDEHTCPRVIRNKIVTSTWIAKRYLNVFRLRPEMTIKELRQDLMERYMVEVSKWKLYKAKNKAITELRGLCCGSSCKVEKLYS